jgi:hypothetical protein
VPSYVVAKHALSNPVTNGLFHFIDDQNCDYFLCKAVYTSLSLTRTIVNAPNDAIDYIIFGGSQTMSGGYLNQPGLNTYESNAALSVEKSDNINVLTYYELDDIILSP